MAEMMVRRVGIFSVAKIEGLLMFVVGLFIGVIYGLIFIIFGAAIMASMPQRSGGDQALGAAGPIVIGIIMMIAFPIFYGIMGFIGGAIGAVIYNIAAGIVGGIKLELEATAPQYAAPPTPQQWSGNPHPAN
jgi:hypothetical protein